MSDVYGEHFSVLQRECLDFLNVNKSKEERFFADLTFGAGGHSLAICKFLNSQLYSFDQDQDAIKNGQTLIEKININNIKLIHSNFINFNDHTEDILFDGIMLDLGVSSHQFDTAERGFSFRFDVPLDMRMDQSSDKITAEDIVNDYDEKSLKEIFFNYGEEKFTHNIVKNILETRSKGRIQSTKELEDIIFHSYPKKLRFGKLHPATKVFQALRIEVNEELKVLEAVLPILMDKLDRGGRLVVISFHSLEDRIVKRSFKSFSQKDKNIGKILTKRPLMASQDELDLNNRSRSAKLRVIEKL